jgi:hypothetical protein
MWDSINGKSDLSANIVAFFPTMTSWIWLSTAVKPYSAPMQRSPIKRLAAAPHFAMTECRSIIPNASYRQSVIGNDKDDQGAFGLNALRLITT